MGTPRTLRLVAVLGLFLASCASYRTERTETLEDLPTDWNALPYHVAVVPLQARDVEATGEGGDRDDAAFRYEIPASVSDATTGDDVVTRSLRDVLDDQAFQTVTVLAPPSPEDYALIEEGGLDAYWLAAAREA
ncbi:MAG: hypothetical protein AAGA56_29215, partial [Myxococcota bacterium]